MLLPTDKKDPSVEGLRRESIYWRVESKLNFFRNLFVQIIWTDLSVRVLLPR